MATDLVDASDVVIQEFLHGSVEEAVVKADVVEEPMSNAQEAPPLLGGVHGFDTILDAKNFRVIQGRRKEKPNREKVDSIKRAIESGKKIARVIVYRDTVTRDKFSPNGGHRQQAFDELRLPVPVTIYEVTDAKERAEDESCRANEENGLSRSNDDKRYQAGKAIDILQKRLGRVPKPKELAKFTETSGKFCRDILRNHFSGEGVISKEGELDDNELETNIPTELQGILDRLRKIKYPAEWRPGGITKPILDDIGKEVRNIANYKGNSPGITKEMLESFMDKHHLDRRQMGKLIEVKPITISRWLKDPTKITDSNIRILRQTMALNPKQIATILEGDDDA